MSNDSEQYSFIKIRAEDIPIHLIEQVRTSDWTPERYLDYLMAIEDSPLQFLFGIYRMQELIGFTWCEANLLDRSLFINTLSIEKSHKNDGKTLSEISKLFKRFLSESKLQKIRISSDRPSLFIKMGMRRSKHTLLELEA